MQILLLLLPWFGFCFIFNLDIIPINFKLQCHWGQNLISFLFSRVGNIHYCSILGKTIFEKLNITLLTPFNCRAEPSLIKDPSVIENCFTSIFQCNFVDSYPWPSPPPHTQLLFLPLCQASMPFTSLPTSSLCLLLNYTPVLPGLVHWITTTGSVQISVGSDVADGVMKYALGPLSKHLYTQQTPSQKEC